MSTRTLRWATALAVGAAIGGFSYWIVTDTYLAGATALCWGVAGGFLLRIYHRHGNQFLESGWVDPRWTALTIGLVAVAGLPGLTTIVSGEARLGIGWLVLGVGLVGYLGGTLSELERRARRERLDPEVEPVRERG